MKNFKALDYFINYSNKLNNFTTTSHYMKGTIKHLCYQWAGLACVSAFITNTVSAQPGNEDDVVSIQITAEQKDIYDVLPDRETDSMFGMTKSMDDIPRSITLVESELIDLLGIRTVNDFVAITPGSFTGNYFGVPGALDLRGERADNFFRGFRRIENRGNFPTSIVAADYVEIIKGHPPAIYGGGKVGGILNFVPKSAESKTAQLIGQPIGLASLTFGSYNKRLGSFEAGLPFKIGDAESGVYIVGQVENSEHFYDDIYNKNQILQVAFDTRVNENLSFSYGLMAQDANLNQSLGWNRVTQELIDSEGKMYLAGEPSLYLDIDGSGFLEPSEIDAFDLEQFAFANPFPYGALTPEQQSAFMLDPATVGLTEISHHTVQAEKLDFSSSEVYTAYFDVVFGDPEFGNWTIKNQSFYDDMDHQKYSSYGFTADYDAYVFENKTTFAANYDIADVIYDVVLGFSWRKSDGIEQESRGRGFQVLDRRDISRGVTPNSRFEGAYTLTGNVPYNWVQDSEFTDTGLFALLDAQFYENFNVLLGARWDKYDVDTYGTDLSGAYDKVSDDDTSFSYNVSLTYAATPNLNFYVTHATSEYVELGQGGMIGRPTVETGTWVQESEMSEFGVKGWLFDRSLYLSGTYYEQDKTAFNNLAFTFDTYESKGLELEARWAATENLSFTAAATKQETEQLNSPFFLGVPPTVLGLDPSLTYGGRFVGVGALMGINGPFESPIPETLYSLNGVYTSNMGWGVSLGATAVDSMYAGYSRAVTLPSYVVTRAAFFYENNDFSLRLNANNLFDEKYYTPQFLFWDVFVSPSIGPTAELTMTYKW